MSVREIISDGCYLGWPTVVATKSNRQTAYCYLEADEQVVCEERDNGETVIRDTNWQWSTTYGSGLEPVIIRRPSRTKDKG